MLCDCLFLFGQIKHRREREFLELHIFLKSMGGLLQGTFNCTGKLYKAPSTGIRIFLNPQFFLSGYGYRPHASANSTANPDIFKSALQSGKNNTATNPITCGRANPDIFESHDVANSYPVSYRTIYQCGGTTATTRQTVCRHYHALYGACSGHILLQRSLGYYSESEYHRMRVDRRIRFEYATCERGNFLIWKEKVADSKISEYMWTGPKKV